MVQAVGELFHHAADHGHSLLGTELGRSRKILRRGTAFKPGQLAAHEADPRRVFRRTDHHRAPDRYGIGPAAILLGREAEKVASLHVLRIERDRPFERRLRLGRDDAVGATDQRLAQIRLPLSGLAAQAKQVAACLDGLIETPEPQIDRSDHLPAAGILRIGLQMRLDLQHKVVDRLVPHIGRARQERLARQIRRSHLEIEPAGAQRQDEKRDDGDQAPMPSGRRRRQRAGRCRVCVRRPDEPARHLDLGGLRLHIADLSRRPVTLNFFKLVAIDREVAPGLRHPLAARKRPQHGKDRHRGHQREQEP